MKMWLDDNFDLTTFVYMSHRSLERGSASTVESFEEQYRYFYTWQSDKQCQAVIVYLLKDSYIVGR